MKIRPLHDRVIVKRLDEEKMTASGIVIPDTAAEKSDLRSDKAHMDEACIEPFEETPMRHLWIRVFLTTLLASLAWLAPANGQTGAPSVSAKRAQAERNAVDLKQGMTIEEVQQLLGKPQRT